MRHLRKGLTGLVVDVIAVVVVTTFGASGMVLGLAALFVLMVDSLAPPAIGPSASWR
jgi:hypothetical protein